MPGVLKVKVFLHDLAFPFQKQVHRVGPGTAAHKGLLVAEQAFAGSHGQFPAGDLCPVRPDHIQVKKPSKDGPLF